MHMDAIKKEFSAIHMCLSAEIKISLVINWVVTYRQNTCVHKEKNTSLMIFHVFFVHHKNFHRLT